MKRPNKPRGLGVPKPVKKTPLKVRKLVFNTAKFAKQFAIRARSAGWVGNGALPTKMLMPYVLSRLSSQNGLKKVFAENNRVRRILESTITDAQAGKTGYAMAVNLCYRAHLTKPQAELIINELSSFAQRIKELELFAKNTNLKNTDPNLKGVNLDNRF